ncbi:MAG: hypothetical protein SWH68_03330 [Thermodesulfobacteriota bacterium]|nr:hypothetical protein [Thermodesulfobacteriota bacterium]
MCLTITTSFLPEDPAGARRQLEKAFGAADDLDAIKFLAWSAIVDTYCIEWNDFKPLDHWIAWMEKALAAGIFTANTIIFRHGAVI